jgi:hypothetical protein
VIGFEFPKNGTKGFVEKSMNLIEILNSTALAELVAAQSHRIPIQLKT